MPSSSANRTTGSRAIVHSAVYCGVPAAMIDLWDPEAAFDMLRRYQCAFMAGATPFLRGLVEVARGRDVTITSLRNFLCGGASVPPSLVYEAMQLFPNCIAWRNYGSTEAPTLTRSPASRADMRLGTLGDADAVVVEGKIPR